MQVEKRGVGRPPVITTEGLTNAASQLVKANGLESLTVGQVAKELDVTTRALYHHIDGLRDHHRLVCDHALATIGNKSAGLSPSDAIRLMLTELRDVIDEYRGLAKFVLQFGMLSEGMFVLLDKFIAQLRLGGFDDELAVNNALMLLSWQASIMVRQHTFEDEVPNLVSADPQSTPDFVATMPVFERMTHVGLYQFEYDAIVEPVLMDLS
jgi:AcrR family transcriptional regulator